MVLQRGNIISESEKNRILNLYNRPLIAESIVIKDWLSPDEKYCIFLDDLYDIENKTKIGNIWENFDHFKFFLKHSFDVTKNISREIKESVLESINSMIITESNQNMVGLKEYVKEFLSEQQGFLGNTLDYIKQTGKESLQGIKDFASTSIDGLKKAYTSIKDADWSKAFEIIKKGALYVARSIRSAVYNPIGIILDAILLATGIGKSAQFVIWAVVVGLDLYELMTGNYENPNLALEWRLLLLGVDILGLVFAGGVAKAAKSPIGALIRKFGSSSKGFSNAVKSSPFLQGTIKKILSGVKGAGSMVGKALTYLQKNSPKIYNFLSKPMSALGRFVNQIIKLLGESIVMGYKAITLPGNVAKAALGGGKLGAGAKALTNVGIPIAAAGGYYANKENQRFKEIAKAIEGGNIKPDYENLDW